MTIGELKEKLDQFPDDLIVVIPTNITNAKNKAGYTVAHNVSRGVNELDGVVFIDDFVEE